ncbi:MAG: ATP-binding protein [Oscillospiraceae bacterium]|nr:ATP-binding protein [Oscillospiraceae bacterium]
MLAKITLENFKSFKNTETIDLTKTNYTILPQNVADNGVLKGCIFVGANASGKSTIILAVKLLLDFLFSERNLNSGIFICMFGDHPCYSLSYDFLIEKKNIHYSFEVDAGKSMISEKLYVDNKLMLERMGLSAKSYIADEKGVNYDETDVGKDTLFLRTLYFNTKFASSPVLKSWMEYLKKSIYINMFDRKIISYGNTDVSVAQYLDKSGCKSINDFFDEYNFEQNIEYEHSSEGRHVKLVIGTDESEKYIFFKRKGIEVPIPFAEESLGNQNLLRILPSFLSVIENDGILLIDEFSSGFHNELENLLVRYFMEKSRFAQMLFVSHSTNLLSNSILRPDQEYSVEFQSDTGSSVKRFSSEQPRSAQNIEKMYVSGVFGGLPEYKEVDHEIQ